MLRKQRKTLGGYFILAHLVDFDGAYLLVVFHHALLEKCYKLLSVCACACVVMSSWLLAGGGEVCGDRGVVVPGHSAPAAGRGRDSVGVCRPISHVCNKRLTDRLYPVRSVISMLLTWWCGLLVNVLCSINVVALCRARFINGWVTLGSQPPRSTQPGHSSKGRCSECKQKLGNKEARHACTSPVSVVWQCKLVSGWGLRQQRSAPYKPCSSGQSWSFFMSWIVLLSQCSWLIMTAWWQYTVYKSLLR